MESQKISNKIGEEVLEKISSEKVVNKIGEESIPKSGQKSSSKYEVTKEWLEALGYEFGKYNDIYNDRLQIWRFFDEHINIWPATNKNQMIISSGRYNIVSKATFENLFKFLIKFGHDYGFVNSSEIKISKISKSKFEFIFDKPIIKKNKEEWLVSLNDLLNKYNKSYKKYMKSDKDFSFIGFKKKNNVYYNGVVKISVDKNGNYKVGRYNVGKNLSACKLFDCLFLIGYNEGVLERMKILQKDLKALIKCIHSEEKFLYLKTNGEKCCRQK